MIKKISALILSIALIFSLMASFTITETRAADLKKDKGIKKISDVVNTYIAYGRDEYPKMCKTGVIKLNTSQKYNIAGLSLVYKADWDNMYDHCPQIKNSIFKKQYKNLFGTVPDLKKDETPKTVMVRNEGNIYSPVSGEWGGVWPSYEIVKVSDLGNDKYCITINNCFSEYTDGDAPEQTSYGRTKIVVKKSNKSSFGYIIKKIKKM